jgi:prolyl-tRNA editing enzyme YbaK/EbsC (Cys-tRNA(Pro) deacylase)
MEGLSGSVRRVAEELHRLGMDTPIVTMPDSTRSAPEAAAAIGCDVAQIVKSLVFRDAEEDEPVLVLVSGADRVDEGRLAGVVGHRVERASGTFVRDRTGFAIGGVPPVGHRGSVSVFMDEGLFDHDTVWAAAGTPHAVFATTPVELQRAAGAEVVAVATG